jgi:osmotically-inducible protein OsmY
MRRILLALTLALCPLTISAAPRSSNTMAAATNIRASDAEIQQRIATKLAKSKIGKDGITAKVKGGVVTWEGHTSVPQHKGAATRMAKTAGAVRVINNIQAGDGAKPSQPVRRAKVE